MQTKVTLSNATGQILPWSSQTHSAPARSDGVQVHETDYLSISFNFTGGVDMGENHGKNWCKPRTTGFDFSRFCWMILFLWCIFYWEMCCPFVYIFGFFWILVWICAWGRDRNMKERGGHSLGTEVFWLIHGDFAWLGQSVLLGRSRLFWQMAMVRPQPDGFGHEFAAAPFRDGSDGELLYGPAEGECMIWIKNHQIIPNLFSKQRYST